jgi:hypothetical protein
MATLATIARFVFLSILFQRSRAIIAATEWRVEISGSVSHTVSPLESRKTLSSDFLTVVIILYKITIFEITRSRMEP